MSRNKRNIKIIKTLLLVVISLLIFVVSGIFLAHFLNRDNEAADRVSVKHESSDYNMSVSDERDKKIEELKNNYNVKDSIIYQYMYGFTETAQSDLGYFDYDYFYNNIRKIKNDSEKHEQDKIRSENEYIGTWSFEYNIEKIVADEIGVHNKTIYFPVTVIVEIDENGIINAYADKDSIYDGLDMFISSSMDAIYEAVKNMGYTESEANLFIAFMYNGSWKEYILSEYGETISKQLNDSSMRLNYDVSDNTLCVWNANEDRPQKNSRNNNGTFKIEGDTMVLTTIPGIFEDMMPGIEAPLTMKRVNK